MSTSACSHRWIIGVFPPGKPKDVPLDIVATNSCTDAERIVQEIRNAAPHLKVEAARSRIKHFEGWISEGTAE